MENSETKPRHTHTPRGTAAYTTMTATPPPPFHHPPARTTSPQVLMRRQDANKPNPPAASHTPTPTATRDTRRSQPSARSCGLERRALMAYGAQGGAPMADRAT